jgi:hypothetical protein
VVESIRRRGVEVGWNEMKQLLRNESDKWIWKQEESRYR